MEKGFVRLTGDCGSKWQWWDRARGWDPVTYYPLEAVVKGNTLKEIWLQQSLIPPAPLMSDLVEKRFCWNKLLQIEWKLQRRRPFLWCQRKTRPVLYCHVHPKDPKPESCSKGPLVNSCWSDWISPNHRCYYLQFPVPTFTAACWKEALLKRACWSLESITTWEWKLETGFQAEEGLHS